MDTITLKNVVCTAAGVIGAAVAKLLGGWNSAITTLFIFMMLDYVTGLVVAGIFTNSDKTASGGLSSKACLRGLFKKIGMLIIVIAAHRIDIILGVDYIRNAVIIAFISNELLSLVENIGLMGVPMPRVLTKAIDVLKAKGEADEDK